MIDKTFFAASVGRVRPEVVDTDRLLGVERRGRDWTFVRPIRGVDPLVMVTFRKRYAIAPGRKKVMWGPWRMAFKSDGYRRYPIATRNAMCVAAVDRDRLERCG